MTSSVVGWTALAVLLFWAVGAYNRLVRLRGDLHTAFGALSADLARQVELVREELVDKSGSAPPPPSWEGLQAAAAQLAAAVASARQKPFDGERIAALGAAQGVLSGAWDRAARDDDHDLRGPRLPAGVSARRKQAVLQVHGAATQFRQAVDRYNEAIGQFPALVLAWLFGFKPARSLAVSVEDALG